MILRGALRMSLSPVIGGAAVAAAMTAELSCDPADIVFLVDSSPAHWAEDVGPQVKQYLSHVLLTLPVGQSLNRIGGSKYIGFKQTIHCLRNAYS